jgi:hypothetical protein
VLWVSPNLQDLCIGGGVNGTITIVRSTVSDNFAAGSGGGFDDENGFIVRATQFFEFVGGIAQFATEGQTVRLPPVLMQPNS